MAEKFRDKKKNYSIDEESYSHPRRKPYKREPVHWQDFLEDETTDTGDISEPCKQ